MGEQSESALGNVKIEPARLSVRMCVSGIAGMWDNCCCELDPPSSSPRNTYSIASRSRATRAARASTGPGPQTTTTSSICLQQAVWGTRASVCSSLPFGWSLAAVGRLLATACIVQKECTLEPEEKSTCWLHHSFTTHIYKSTHFCLKFQLPTIVSKAKKKVLFVLCNSLKKIG